MRVSLGGFGVSAVGCYFAAFPGSAAARDESGVGGAVLGLIGEGRRHSEFDAPYAGSHQGADLEQLEADGAASGAGELGVDPGDATQRANQHIGHRSEPQPQLVGTHRARRSAVGEEVELALLNAVFHVAAGAIELLVEMPALVLLA